MVLVVDDHAPRKVISLSICALLASPKATNLYPTKRCFSPDVRVLVLESELSVRPQPSGFTSGRELRSGTSRAEDVLCNDAMLVDIIFAPFKSKLAGANDFVRLKAESAVPDFPCTLDFFVGSS